MKIVIKKNNIGYFLIFVLFIFSFTAGMGEIVYRQTLITNIWRVLYVYSIYGMFAASLLYIFYHNYVYRHMDAFCTAIIFYLIYETAVTFIFRNCDIRELIMDGYTWPLTFVSFYLYFKKEYNPDIGLNAFRYVFIVGALISMYLLKNNITIHLYGDGMMGGVIGPIYYLLAFVPLAFFLCKSHERLILVAICVVMVLVSTKRAGTLIVVIGLVALFLCKAHMERRLSKKLERYILLGLGVAIAGVVGMELIEADELDVFARLLNSFDDQGSGRISIWIKVVDYFNNSELVKKIFGHGFHSVPYEVCPLNRYIYAHNSYLEVLYDLGIVGLVWLLLLLVLLAKELAVMIKKKIEYAPVLAYSMVNIILLSLLGYFFEESVTIVPVAILWGMCLGIYRNESVRTKQESINVEG